MRVHQDGRGPGEALGEAAFLPEDLRAQIKTTGQARRTDLAEVGPDRVIVGGNRLRPVMLVIEDWQRQSAVRFDECAARAMRGRGNGVDGVVVVEDGERIKEEGPHAICIVMRVWSRAQQGVRYGARDDFGETLQIDDGDLGIGLANIEHRHIPRVLRRHSMWNTVSSGTATGSLSGLVCMMSAM